MGSDFNPYEVLGAAHEATPAGLKRLYRDLTKRHHPDVGGDRANWDRLTLAYEILSDPDRRAFYDQTGRIDKPNPDNDRQQAHALIAEQITMFADQFVMAKFNPQFDPRRQPIMELVEQHLRNELAKTEEALQTGRSHLNFWNDFIKRITRRAEAQGIDQIDAIMKQKISGITQQIIHVEEVVRVRRIAIEVLADYSFERDQPDFPTYTASTGTWS